MILYVHDAGVREAACEQRVLQLAAGLQNAGLSIPVEACQWGEAHGARLAREGRSIPEDVAPISGTQDLPQSRRDGVLFNATAPLAGDMLLYQARGDAIRDFIEARVRACGPGVVLLGHGLGGVACIDILATKVLIHVQMLVTVGSPAPLLYELGALSSLAPGQNLPLNFPRRWFNFYDRGDFLSCCAQPIFLGDAIDHEVTSGKAYPEAHTAYFDNPQFWEKLKTVLAG